MLDLGVIELDVEDLCARVDVKHSLLRLDDQIELVLPLDAMLEGRVDQRHVLDIASFDHERPARLVEFVLLGEPVVEIVFQVSRVSRGQVEVDRRRVGGSIADLRRHLQGRKKTSMRVLGR